MVSQIFAAASGFQWQIVESQNWSSCGFISFVNTGEARVLEGDSIEPDSFGSNSAFVLRIHLICINYNLEPNKSKELKFQIHKFQILAPPLFVNEYKVEILNIGFLIGINFF